MMSNETKSLMKMRKGNTQVVKFRFIGELGMRQEKDREDKCRNTEERHMMYRKLCLYAIAAASHSLWNQMRYKLIDKKK